MKEGNKVAVNLMEDCEGGVGYSCCQLLLIVTFVTIEDSHPVEDCERDDCEVGFGNRRLLVVVFFT